MKQFIHTITSRFFLTIIAIFISFTLVNAQNIEGHWYGTVKDAGRVYPLLFIFHSSQKHLLTGKIITPLGARPLENCQMNADSLFFFDRYGPNILQHYAKIYPDSISMKMKGLWGNDNFYYFTLTRKKSLNNTSTKTDSMFVQDRYNQ